MSVGKVIEQTYRCEKCDRKYLHGTICPRCGKAFGKPERVLIEFEDGVKLYYYPYKY